MKIAFQNFLTTLKRYRTASILNIAGLTLAFFAMYVIMTQVFFYVRYNQCVEDNERVYMLGELSPTNRISDLVGRPLVEQAIAQSPAVEVGGMILCPMYDPATHFFWVHRPTGEITRFRSSYVKNISLPMLDIIPLDVIAGDKRELARPNTVIVSQSEAKRLGVGLGDIISMPKEYSEDKDDAPERDVEVVAIYKDLPKNCYFSEFAEAAMFENFGDKNMDMKWWGMGAHTYFIKIKEGSSPDDFLDVYNKILSDFLRAEDSEEDIKRYVDANLMLPITEMQWANMYNKVGGDCGVNLSDPATMSIVVSVAVLILVMAFINFVNFFFALVPVRLRAVNISKVFGASIATLRWSFVFEAIGLVVCALALMSYLSFTLMDLPLDSYLVCPVQVSQNPLALLAVIAIGILMAIVAALYPAWYITSFNPSLAVKAGFAGSTYGKRLRIVLICVQFTISMILIIVTLFVGLQYRHMVNFDLGFEQTNLLTFKTSNTMAQKSDVLRAELSSHPDVVGVASTDRSFFNNTIFCSFNFTEAKMEYYAASVDQDINLINIQCVSPNFFDVIGLRLMQGRWIDEKDAIDSAWSTPAVGMMSISAAQKYNIYIRDDLRRKSNNVIRYISGYVNDIYTTSVDKRRFPVVYIITTDKHRHYYLRLQPTANVEEVKGHIRASIAKVNPQEEIPEIHYFTQVVKNMYADVQQSMYVVGCFALVAIVISLMGVFGIVLFETQHRRREIAIRKVFGSTTSELLWLLNSRYAKIVVACFIAAVPVAWYVVDRWLQNFAQRIELHWWVFVVAFVIVMGITLTLVTTRSWRAANENPADVVKSE